MNSDAALGPMLMEISLRGKSRLRMSMTGNVKMTSPTLVKETTKIFLIFDFSNGLKDVLHFYRLHAKIVGAVEIITGK